MANTSKFWFFPDGSDRMAEIDFGRTIPDIVGPDPRYFGTTQETLSGVQTRITHWGRSEVVIKHGPWNRGTQDASGDGSLLRRRLFTLVAHLQRGGTCVFAGHSDYAFAGFALIPPSSQTGSITVDRNLMSNLSGGLLISGREVVVQSAHDQYLIEYKVVGTHATLTIPLVQNLATDMSTTRWVLVREYFTYPALRMPAELRNQPLSEFLSHEHEAVFRLHLTLEEDPAAMDAYNVFGNPIPGTAHGPDTVIIPDAEIHNPGSTGQNAPYEWKG